MYFKDADNLWGQGMNEGELLELIWGGALDLRDADAMSPLARLLDALLVVPTVTLVSSGGLHRPVAMAEGNELLPGAPLGDVLTEELGIHVPRDAIVLIEPAAMADATKVSGAELGRELGNILISMASAPLDVAVRHPVRPAATGAGPDQYSPQAVHQGTEAKYRQRVATA